MRYQFHIKALVAYALIQLQNRLDQCISSRLEDLAATEPLHETWRSLAKRWNDGSQLTGTPPN
jgi:hypothetical protein